MPPQDNEQQQTAALLGPGPGPPPRPRPRPRPRFRPGCLHMHAKMLKQIRKSVKTSSLPCKQVNQ